MTAEELDAHWQHLFATALLGTDRRGAPPAPAGPIAELLAEHPPADDAASVLTQAAVATALRRAGTAPGPALPTLQAPQSDPRPTMPAAAAVRLERIVANWPILEDEWLQAAIDNGWRLAPDSVVLLLRRHRTDADRTELVAAAAGPIAGWVTEHITGLAPTHGRTTAGTRAFELPASLMPLLQAPPTHVATVIGSGLRAARFGAGDRLPLAVLVASVDEPVLHAVADALQDLEASGCGSMLGAYLADLARTRCDMLDELRTPAAPPNG